MPIRKSVAQKELERRRNFERYRYYKIPSYLMELAQAEAHTKILRCPNKVGKSTYCLFEAFWGATDTHPYKFLKHKQYQVPNITWLMGPTLAHVEEVFIEGMRQWGMDKFWKGGSLGRGFSTRRGRVLFDNGSIVYCKSYDERKNIQGRAIKRIIIDEECTSEIWHEIMFRFKAGDPMDILIAATPVECEEWLADLCDKASDGAQGLYLAPDISIYDAHVDKGGHLTTSDITRIESLCHDDLERQIRLFGKPVKRAGRVLPLESDMHKFSMAKAFPEGFPSSFLHLAGLDPHQRKPACCIWGALDPATGDIYIYDYAQLYGTVKQHAEEFLKRSKYEIFAIYIDPAAKNAMKTNLQEVDWNYFDALSMEIPTIPIIESVRSPEIVIDSIKHRLSYDANKSVSGDNRPHLFFADYLDDLWARLLNVRWREFRDRSLLGANESIVKGKNDELMALGYMVVKNPLYIKSESYEEHALKSGASAGFEYVHQEMGY
jgi:hypothetical protein